MISTSFVANGNPKTIINPRFLPRIAHAATLMKIKALTPYWPPHML
jgi:hypothetical protein